MEKDTLKLIGILMIVLGLFATAFPGELGDVFAPQLLSGTEVIVTFEEPDGSPIVGALCYSETSIEAGSGSRTDSDGKVTFTHKLDGGKWVGGCYCPGTTDRAKGETYLTHITLVKDCGGASGTTTTTQVTPPTTIPTEPYCIDSDDDEDIYTKGKITYNTGYRWDICYGSSDRVVETYCDGSDPKTKIIDCPSGYICDDGRCVSETATRTCSETDSGADIYDFGEVTETYDGVTVTFRDQCYTGDIRIKEYYCVGNAATSIIKDCPANTKCIGGECTGELPEVPEICRDTDGGKDQYVSGKVYPWGVNFYYYDSCHTDNIVKEFYCGTTGYDYVFLLCEGDTTCIQGECVKTEGSETMIRWIGLICALSGVVIFLKG